MPCLKGNYSCFQSNVTPLNPYLHVLLSPCPFHDHVHLVTMDFEGRNFLPVSLYPSVFYSSLTDSLYTCDAILSCSIEGTIKLFLACTRNVLNQYLTVHVHETQLVFYILHVIAQTQIVNTSYSLNPLFILEHSLHYSLLLVHSCSSFSTYCVVHCPMSRL